MTFWAGLSRMPKLRALPDLAVADSMKWIEAVPGTGH